jgi:hypothetical protein
MDQPATTKKPRLNADPGSFEVIEPSRALLRPGIVMGIDSLRRHLLYALWAGSTAFRYVTPRGLTQDDGPILERPGPTRSAAQLVHQKATE